jgi:hypothetical protein
VTALPIKKSYKSHCKTFENKHSLAVAFFAFWAISLFNCHIQVIIQLVFKYNWLNLINEIQPVVFNMQGRALLSIVRS